MYRLCNLFPYLFHIPQCKRGRYRRNDRRRHSRSQRNGNIGDDHRLSGKNTVHGGNLRLCHPLDFRQNIGINRLVQGGTEIVNKGAENDRCHHTDNHAEYLFIGILCMFRIFMDPSADHLPVEHIYPAHKQQRNQNARACSQGTSRGTINSPCGIRLPLCQRHKAIGGTDAHRRIQYLLQNLGHRCLHHSPMGLKISSEYPQKPRKENRRGKYAKHCGRVFLDQKPCAEKCKQAGNPPDDQHINQRALKYPVSVFIFPERQFPRNHFGYCGRYTVGRHQQDNGIKVICGAVISVSLIPDNAG